MSLVNGCPLNRSFETPLLAAPQDEGWGCLRLKDLMLRRLRSSRLEARGLSCQMRERCQ